MDDVQLNHTVIFAYDRHLSAEFLTTVLGLEVGAPFGPFLPVDLGNGVTLDYYEKRDEPIQSQHYAFLVPEEQFDGMIAQLRRTGSPTTRTPATPNPAGSTGSSAGTAPTSATRTATTWRS